MDEEIILYSTGCPKCNLLKQMLDASKVEYIVCTDVDGMLKLGINSVPILSVNGKLKDYVEASQWIKANYGGEI